LFFKNNPIILCCNFPEYRDIAQLAWPSSKPSPATPADIRV
jgi:hypothetical protein